MSRLAFVADVHIGNPTAFGGPVSCGINERGLLILDTLRAAILTAKDCDALVICGDLFDTANPSPQLIAAVMALLEGREPLEVHILMGNHDMVSDAPGDHALDPLGFLPGVHVHHSPDVVQVKDTNLFVVPFMVGDCRIWFPEELAFLRERNAPREHEVLAFHLGVVEENTPVFLSQAHDAIPLPLLEKCMEDAQLKHAFCGNWHNPGRWGDVHQVGALCPTGWDNAGWDYGRVMVLDTALGNAVARHVPGPRFLTASTMDEVEVLIHEAKRRKCELFLSLKGPVAKQLDEVRELGVHARAVADTAQAREATRAAAVAVRKASTLDEALARYVQGMHLDDSLDRERVKAMAATYLAKGGAA